VLLQLYKWMVVHQWVGGDWIIGAIIFRSALAILASFLTVLLIGGRVIRWLMRQKVGDMPEFYNATLNELTKNKKNTPTMGGIMIIGAILLNCIIFADVMNFYVRMALFCMIYLSVLGGVDDWLKLTQGRRTPGSREGLFAWEKMLFQVGLGFLLAIFIYHHGSNPPLAGGGGTPVPVPTPAQELNWPFFRDLTLPAWLFWMLTVVTITGSSNAVNLTDGMDGLASGCMVIVSIAFMALVYATGVEEVAKPLHFHWIRQTGELAVVCGAIAGACLGFLWYNCNPAQVFMGDTGSLALGGVIGYVAIVIRQEPMLLLIGGIFVVEAASVMMQVSYFRMTGGKRIFLCSPIHHHFHLKGWSEQQVVVRFWLISALCAAFGLATVKLR
jgi:phospho-N-acetylmuramoyl-pentapeptide-transferase